MYPNNCVLQIKAKYFAALASYWAFFPGTKGSQEIRQFEF
jgi:hypothetical protein